jgi:NAD(P)-dependent dehydrogenase (short-subunit alcohol dehydrogenase family)
MSGGRVWVVTGASRGIGAAIARAALEEGDSVALIARGAAVIELAQSLGMQRRVFSVMSRIQSQSVKRLKRSWLALVELTRWLTTQAFIVAERFTV